MTPITSFSIGLALLALFIWYFGTDSDKRQRLIGTLLTLGLVGFCLISVFPPDKKINKGMDLAGGVRFTLELQLPEEAKEGVFVGLTQELEEAQPVVRIVCHIGRDELE